MAACVLALSSCRIERAKTYDEAKFKNVAVKDFRNINVACAYNVVFEQAERTDVTIKAPEELLDQVSIESDGKTLVISNNSEIGNYYRPIFIKGGSIGENELITIYVSAPDIDEITVTGPAEFKVRSSLTTDKLKVTLTGSGDIDLRHVKCQSAELCLTGSGDIEMRPIEAETIKASVTGSGDIDMRAINAKMIDVSVSGSGDIFIPCVNCDKAVASVTGSGDVEFRGQINDVKQNVTGSGSVGVDRDSDIDFLFEDNDTTLTE